MWINFQGQVYLAQSEEIWKPNIDFLWFSSGSSFDSRFGDVKREEKNLNLVTQMQFLAVQKIKPKKNRKSS